jgi:hypothetical protein
MHLSHAMGAGTALAMLGWFTLSGQASTTSDAAVTPPATPAAAAPLPATAVGHYLLVVEGDRDSLTITAASHKADPWAGVPKGFTSEWQLDIHDGSGAMLAEIPLDVSAFATGALDKGRPLQVQGCVIRDARIGMLVSVPAFPTAATWTFVRRATDGAPLVLGTVAGNRVRELAGGGR